MDEDRLVWAVDPPRAGRDRAVVLLVALGAFALGWVGFGKPLFGLIGFGLIVGSAMDRLVPSRFVLDPKGASARTGLSATAMEWTAVRRVLEREGEIRLSPLAKPSRLLDTTRGVGLVPTLENRDTVLAFVESHIGRQNGEQYVRDARLLEGGPDRSGDRSPARQGRREDP